MNVAQGVNGQLALWEDRQEDVLAVVRAALDGQTTDVFQWTPDRLSVLGSPQDAFSGLRIRSRPLVAEPRGEQLGVEFGSDATTDVAADPSDWHALLPRAKVVLDCRNFYETAIGTFSSERAGISAPVMTDTHNDTFDAVARELRERGVGANDTVLLACTGGIRCERIVRKLRGEGFRAATALRGGIVAYANAVRDGSIASASSFRGRNYVFDGRGSVGVTAELRGRCQHCGAPASSARNCANRSCGVVLLQCPVCEATLRGACSPACAASSCLLAPARRRHVSGRTALALRDRAHSMPWTAVTTGLWVLDPSALGSPALPPSPAFAPPGPVAPADLAKLSPGDIDQEGLSSLLGDMMPSQGAREATPPLPEELLAASARAGPSLRAAEAAATDGMTVHDDALRRFAWWAPSRAEDGSAHCLPHLAAPSAAASRGLQARIASITRRHVSLTLGGARAGRAASRGLSSAAHPGFAEALPRAVEGVLARGRAAMGVRHDRNRADSHTLCLLVQLAAAQAAGAAGRTGLDLGTLGGASAAAMAAAGLRVVTVDADGAASRVAAESLAAEGLGGLVTCVTADVVAVLEGMAARHAGEAGRAGDAAGIGGGAGLGLVFVDAGKRHTRRILDLLLRPEGGGEPLVAVGGTVVVDDVAVASRPLTGPKEGEDKARRVLERAGAAMADSSAWLQASEGHGRRFVACEVGGGRGAGSAVLVATRLA